MKVQSYSDIITNSSSELFVFEDCKSVNEVIDTLNEIYPDWRKEYCKPATLKNNDFESVSILLDYKLYDMKDDERVEYCKRNNIEPVRYGNYFEYRVKVTKDDFIKELSVAKKFAEDLGSTPERVFDNWDRYNPFASWDDEEELELETYPTMTIYGIGLYQEKYGKHVLLWSKDENPNWDYQKKLMKIATRYHLG